jgi:DNA-binding PadR family transcriptional regulator
VAEDARLPPEAAPLSPRVKASAAGPSLEASELECTVLGIVWRAKEMSAYAVRGVFRDSPSMHWSGSAGAIYPLVERLEERGWLRSRPHSTGRRHGRLYAVTPAGLRALRAWLGPPLAKTAVTVIPDPLRTRMFFLGALAPAERKKFLAEAEKGLLAELRAAERFAETVQQDPDLGHDPNMRDALAGVRATSRARLSWIRALRRSERR